MAYSKSNSFRVLADPANEDPSPLVAGGPKNAAKERPKKVNPQPKLPSKPLARLESAEGGSRRTLAVSDDGEPEMLLEEAARRCYGAGGPRKCYRTARRTCRSGRLYVNQAGESRAVPMSSKPRLFDRYSLHGRGKAIKRDGFGRGNWGTIDDEGLEERPVGVTNCSGTYAMIEERADKMLNDSLNDDLSEEDSEEDKEMTLNEYEKIVEAKKKALQALLLELSAKENDDGSFIKLDLDDEYANGEDFAEDFFDESDEEDLVEGFVVVDAAEDWDVVFGSGVASILNI